MPWLQNKCHQYWPEEPGTEESHGPVTVSTADVESRDHFYIRTFVIKKEKVSLYRPISDEKCVTRSHKMGVKLLGPIRAASGKEVQPTMSSSS